jgi:hypothetical protein
LEDVTERDGWKTVDIREQRIKKMEESKLNPKVTPVFEELEKSNEIVCVTSKGKAS